MDQEEEKYWKKVISTINLFRRYFKGEADSREREAIEKWNPDSGESSFKDTPVNPKIIRKHGMKVKQRVFQELGIANPDERPTAKRKFIAFSPLMKYASVAAALVIVVSVSYFLYHSGSNLHDSGMSPLHEKQLLVETGDFETIKKALPDGTNIHVNTNTRIEYNQKEFGRERREVWLVGEAYFDVTKNPGKPFIIHTREISTTVHGTSFNIKAYDGIGEISISVKTGKVEVSHEQSVLGLLTTNKHLVYRESDKTHAISDRSWEDAAAWMEKRLVLRDANIHEFRIRLQQIYGMKVIIETDALDNSVLNASYPEGANINSVLKGIGELYGVKYAVDEENKVVRIYE